VTESWTRRLYLERGLIRPWGSDASFTQRSAMVRLGEPTPQRWRDEATLRMDRLALEEARRLAAFPQSRQRELDERGV
jgi:hypothetical protein